MYGPNKCLIPNNIEGFFFISFTWKSNVIKKNAFLFWINLQKAKVLLLLLILLSFCILFYFILDINNSMFMK